MEKYRRLLNPMLIKGFFLFGARGTGKTSLLCEIFSADFAEG